MCFCFVGLLLFVFPVSLPFFLLFLPSLSRWNGHLFNPNLLPPDLVLFYYLLCSDCLVYDARRNIARSKASRTTPPIIYLLLIQELETQNVHTRDFHRIEHPLIYSKRNGGIVKRFFRFFDHLISRFDDIPWPLRSPDLTLCSLFLWSYLK